ncbi:MAG: hypothetical protein RL268_2896, partial [Pseudomonadota bacterium]
MSAQLALLHSDQASLVLECRNDGPPLWRHLGARVEPRDLAPLALGRTPASFSLDEDVPFSTAPPSGLGWFGPACLALRQSGQRLVPVFTQAQVSQTEQAIRIVLSDAVSGVELVQSIDLLAGGAFRFSAQVSNRGAAPVEVEQAWLREGRRGISGHGGAPGIVVLDEGANHHAGLVHALQLAWSGDSRIAVERDDEGCWSASA